MAAKRPTLKLNKPAPKVVHRTIPASIPILSPIPFSPIPTKK